jgi:hypothetical protein
VVGTGVGLAQAARVTITRDNATIFHIDLMSILRMMNIFSNFW